MSEKNDEAMPVFDGRAARREEIVARFEDAWHAEERPSIDDFLAGEREERQAILVELVHVDLECRLKAGESARVEEYLRRYSELAKDDDAVAELVGAEYTLRRRREPALAVDEYLQRFPQHSDELAARLVKEMSPTSGKQRPVRLICPQCQNPITVVCDEGADEAVCPCCNSTFRLDRDETISWHSEKLPSLGKLELLETVGQGAFGTVYRARDTKLDRIVAVKVPRSGTFATEEDEDRFVREARSVAQLHHSGIVPVYDVGHTGSFPYIVTEFVDGITLADALTGRRFTFRESAEITAQVARALEHSHQQGVVHRDLKPSNIMLREADGLCALLMDFGLARREEGEVTVTVEGQVLGTPAYMSPEQARGESHRVDGRSDVYSLGVILYELLVNELPFRGNLRMLLHQVLNSEPQAPRRLNDRIPRDLETICLKCLQKEPRKRYASAKELADDLDRFLAGEPVRARRVTRLEKLWRWTKRNPRLASLSAATLALLVAISVVSTVASFLIAASRDRERDLRIDAEQATAAAQAAQAKESAQRRRAEIAEGRANDEAERAQAEAETATKTSDFLVSLFRTADPIGLDGFGWRRNDAENIGGLTARQILSRGAQRIADELTDQPVVQAKLMDTIGSVCRNCGLYDEAETLLQDALRIRQETQGAQHPDVAATLHNLALLVRDKGDYTKAEALCRKALEIRRAHFGDDHLDVAATKFLLAWVLADEGKHADAKLLFQEVLELRTRKLGKSNRDVKITLFALIAVEFALNADAQAAMRSLGNISSALDTEDQSRLVQALVTYQLAMFNRKNHNYTEAERLYRSTLNMVRETFGNDENFFAAALLGDLAGMLRDRGDIRQAEEQIRDALKIGLRLFRTHPEIITAQRELAGLLESRGDFDEAEKLLGEARKSASTVFGEEHCEMAAILRYLGNVFLAKGEYRQAEVSYRQSLSTFRSVYGDQHPEVIYAMFHLANALYDAGAYEEAEPVFRRALESMRAFHPGVDSVPQILHVARFLRDDGRYDEARQLQAEARETVENLIKEGGASTAGECTIMADVLLADNGLEEAEGLLRAALEFRRNELPAEHPGIATSMHRLADLLKDTGKLEEAEELCREALAIRQKKLGPEDPATLDSQMKVAVVLRARGDTQQAIEMGQNALAALRRRLHAKHPRVADLARELAWVYRDAGDYEQARQLLREAYVIRREAHGDAHPDLAETMVELAQILQEEGDYQAAETHLREGRDVLRKALPPGSWRTALVENELGACLISQAPARCAEAESLLVSSYEILRAAHGAEDKRTQQALSRIVDLYEVWGKSEESAKYRSLISNSRPSESEEPAQTEDTNAPQPQGMSEWPRSPSTVFCLAWQQLLS